MKIELATLENLENILNIYEESRLFMKDHNNYSQWKDNYPPKETIIDDINKKVLYIVTNNNEIVGVFALIEGEDETYKNIYDGAWLNSLPYVTLHRLGTKTNVKGVGQFVIDYIVSNYKNIRADTHINNIPMNNLLLKNNFIKCGTIFVKDGSSRIAYQKSRE